VVKGKGGVSVYPNSIPAALAKELDGDTAWNEWNDAVAAQEARFAETKPATAPMGLPEVGQPKGDQRYAATEPSPLAPTAEPARQPQPRVPKTLKLDDLMTEARRNNRVCPLPERWTELYRLMSVQAMGGKAKLPAPPLTGAAWDSTPSLAKRMCFRDHLEWATANSCAAEVYEFMKALGERDWHYMG